MMGKVIFQAANHDSEEGTVDTSSTGINKPVQPKRISDLFSQRSLGSLYLSSTLELLHVLVRLGAKPRADGWRKYATAFLKAEDSRFILTAFNLKIKGGDPADETHEKAKQAILERLAQFFATHPQLWHTRLVWQRQGASIQPNPHLDLVWAEFDEAGNLAAIRAYFAADQGLTQAHPTSPYAAYFIQAYNQARFSGRQRPYHLLTAFHKLAKNTPDPQAGSEYCQRLLDSVFIHFESIQADQKFELPDFSPFPHPGGGAFNILGRLPTPGNHSTDLWFHINHALHDGNPLLEALRDLQQTWGTAEPLVLPPPLKDGKMNLVQPAHPDSGTQFAYAYQFLSFEHLLQERDRLNQKYQHLLKNKITIPGMLIWGLSSQPFLQSKKITSIVDVPTRASTAEPRTLGFFTGKPNQFINGSDKELAFVAYQNFVIEAIEAVRKREDFTYAAMKCQALLPTSAYNMTMSMVPRAVKDIGGHVTLTIMPLADFCAPPGDYTKDAVIAIGNFRLPTTGGSAAGVVCVKSLQDDVQHYWEAIYNTITQWHI
jgi:hypothetical protein